MRTDENLMNMIDAWTEQGWSTPLDRAFVRFLREQQPDSSDRVLLAAALASYQLGRGHICLDLEAVLDDPDGVLSWPPEGEGKAAQSRSPSALLAGCSTLKWVQHIEGSALVSTGAGRTPLVFSNGRLYLRRYWQYEVAVAQGILHRLQVRPAIPADLREQTLNGCLKLMADKPAGTAFGRRFRQLLDSPTFIATFASSAVIILVGLMAWQSGSLEDTAAGKFVKIIIIQLVVQNLAAALFLPALMFLKKKLAGHFTSANEIGA